MIEWPKDELLRPEGRDALRRFRETGAAAELDAPGVRWRVVAWPWTREAPSRVMLEDDQHHVVAFTMGMGGEDIWRLSRAPTELHERSRNALDREASAIVVGPARRRTPGT